MSEVRCVNCRKHFDVTQGTEIATCPYCNTKYRISWPAPNQAKVRGLA